MEGTSEELLQFLIKLYGLTETDVQGTTITYPDMTFNDHMEIDLGDRKVLLNYPRLSHMDGSILVYIPDEKVIFTGDVLFTDFHPNLVDGDLAG